MAEPSGIASGKRKQNRTVALAERQWGVVSRAQLCDIGVSDAAITRWTQAGGLHRIHPGVYAVGHRALRIESRLAAALFYAGRGAALSHATALWWWALRRSAPTVIHVSAPAHAASLQRVVVHHPRQINRVFHERLPVTTVETAIVDYAISAAFHDIRRVLAEAEFRNLLDVGELDAAAGRGRPGSSAVKHALAHHQPRLAHTRSTLEEVLVVLCDDYRLTMP